MALKRSSAFADKLEPIKPDPEKEEAFLGKAAEGAWHDRNVKPEGQGGDQPKASAKPEPALKAASKGKASKPNAKAKSEPVVEQAVDQEKASSPAPKKPARPAPVSASFPELVEQYTEALGAGESLPLPPNPFFQKVDRHRVYTMCPVHTAAALQAYSDAKGYNQMWMAIDDLLRNAELYGPEGSQ